MYHHVCKKINRQCNVNGIQPTSWNLLHSHKHSRGHRNPHRLPLPLRCPSISVSPPCSQWRPYVSLNLWRFFCLAPREHLLIIFWLVPVPLSKLYATVLETGTISAMPTTDHRHQNLPLWGLSLHLQLAIPPPMNSDWAFSAPLQL